jgi:copper chaperone CopZ
MIRNLLLVFAALAMIVPPASAMTAPDRYFDFDVSLLSCAVCRKQIKEILMAIDGVKAVDFDLVNKKCYVTMNGDKALTKESLEVAFRPSKYIFNGVTEKKASETRPADKPKKP